jgi:hypothetical protein
MVDTPYTQDFGAGQVDERQRIVDLLQTLRKQAQEKNLSTMVNINAVIALIKGENK